MNLDYWKKEVATLRAELREARAAGKHQHEENVILIAQLMAALAERDEGREIIRQALTKIERLESALEEAGAAVREGTRVVREAQAAVREGRTAVQEAQVFPARAEPTP